MISRKEVDVYMKSVKFLIICCGLITSIGLQAQSLDKGGKLASVKGKDNFSGAQEVVSIVWEGVVNETRFDGENQKRITFAGALIDPQSNFPTYRAIRKVQGNLDSVAVKVVPIEFENNVTIPQDVDVSELSQVFQVRAAIKRS